MSEHVLVRLAAILVLGIATQWIAWRVRLPAILLLLIVGCLAGPGTQLAAQLGWMHERFLNPNALFGDLLLPAVSLSVALILFEGGLTLNLAELKHGGGVIWRLVSVGAIITWVISAVGGHYILHLDWSLAILLGAILVVTGPTVIGPLLRDVRPTGQVGPVLKWEGIVIDPIGALLAVVVFEAIIGGLQVWPAVGSVVRTLLLSTVVGVAFAGLMILMLRRMWAPDFLHNALSLMLVIAAFSVSNLLQHESGLFAVTVMGLILGNQRLAHVRHIVEFKESLTVLLISALFIILGSRLELSQLAALNWRSALFIILLIVVARPLAVAACAWGSELTLRERLFLAGMAPRGIVAAAVSSVFALRLRAMHIPGAEHLVPLTFAVIIGTVTFYGLTAGWLARRMGLSTPGAGGFLIVGADAGARALAEALKKENRQVLLVDTNPANIQAARLAGLSVQNASILSQYVLEMVELSAIGRLLALTPNAELNSLAAMQFSRLFGRSRVFQLSPGDAGGARKEKVAVELRGRILGDARLTHDYLLDRLEGKATIKKTTFTKEFSFAQFQQLHGQDAIPLFWINEAGELSTITPSTTLAPKIGQGILSLVNPAVAVPPKEPPKSVKPPAA